MSRVCTIIMGINLHCVLILMAGTSAFAYTVPENAAYADVKQITGSLLVFQLDCGRFPSEREGLSVFTRRPADIPESKWERLGNVPTQDPWGHPYIYRFPGIHNRDYFDLYSLGEDGVSNSGGCDSDDINNWDASLSWTRHYADRRSLVGRTRPALLVFGPFVLAGALVLLAWKARGRRLRSASSIAPSITESRAGPK
jgi:type II secretion system protein G